jgi:hypothetical protein
MKRFFPAIIAAALFFSALGSFFFEKHRFQGTFSSLRQELMLIASNAALSIDADLLRKVPLEQAGESSGAYQDISQKLIRIKQTNLGLKYVYILTATNNPGILQFVVDADPLPRMITARSLTSLPGDKYDARSIPEMMNAYDGPSADKDILSDAWGAFVSGYAPIRDSEGNPVAIIGVDADAAFLQAMQNNIRISKSVALFTGILFTLTLAAVILSGLRRFA